MHVSQSKVFQWPVRWRKNGNVAIALRCSETDESKMHFKHVSAHHPTSSCSCHYLVLRSPLRPSKDCSTKPGECFDRPLNNILWSLQQQRQLITFPWVRSIFWKSKQHIFIYSISSAFSDNWIKFICVLLCVFLYLPYYLMPVPQVPDFSGDLSKC